MKLRERSNKLAILQSGSIKALFKQAREKLASALEEHMREKSAVDPESTNIEEALNED